MDTHLPAADHLAASARLRALAERVAGPEAARVSVGEMVDALGDTGLGLTLLLLMLPVFVTIPGLPVGIFFGFLVALLGVQIARGANRLHLPAGIRARTLAAGQVRRVLLATLPWLERAERWLRSGRLAGLTSPPARRRADATVSASACTSAEKNAPLAAAAHCSGGEQACCSGCPLLAAWGWLAGLRGRVLRP